MDVFSQHKTIESVLKRGENLDNLVDKSNDLSSASQVQFIPLHHLHCGDKGLFMCFITACVGREDLFNFDIDLSKFFDSVQRMYQTLH